MPNSMMSAMPSDTITSVIGDEPRRWNGVYTTKFSSTDSSEQAAIAATSPSQTDTPDWFSQYATNAPVVITAANARLSTSVTPNCSVKPIAAIANTAEVISPKPTDARKMLMAGSPPPARGSLSGSSRTAESPGARQSGEPRADLHAARAADHPESARSWATEMLPTTFTVPVALYVSIWTIPAESWKASKLVGPPGPMYLIFLPALSAAAPWAKEFTTVAPGTPSPIVVMKGFHLAVSVLFAAIIASAVRLIPSYRCTAPGAVK